MQYEKYASLALGELWTWRVTLQRDDLKQVGYEEGWRLVQERSYLGAEDVGREKVR